MPWVCGIFKTREWVGGSKLFSNIVLLLVKLKRKLVLQRLGVLLENFANILGMGGCHFHHKSSPIAHYVCCATLRKSTLRRAAHRAY